MIFPNSLLSFFFSWQQPLNEIRMNEPSQSSNEDNVPFLFVFFFFTVLRKENQLTRLQRKWDREMLIITVLEVFFE